MKGFQPLEQTAWRGGEVPVPGGVKGQTVNGSKCHGVVGTVVFSQRVGSMTSDVFPSLIDSVILFSTVRLAHKEKQQHPYV